MRDYYLLFLFLTLLGHSDSYTQNQIGSDIDGLYAGDFFGKDVSISSDGSVVAIVGSGGVNGEGLIRVFKNIGGTWTLYGVDTNGENFGGVGAQSVSLSDDGNTIAFATLNDIVKVFEYNNSSAIWTQKGSDITNTTSFSHFGFSIKLTSDGNTVVIGVPDSPIVPASGTTQVFDYDGTGSWNQVGNDINGLVSAEHSGRSVDMSDDGSIVAIVNDNSARVYQNDSNNWNLYGNEIQITGSQSISEVISLSSDGNILAIGEPDYSDTNIQRGRVRVFEYVLGVWEQIGDTILGDVAYYRTGWSVGLSADGNVLVIGEPGSTSGSTDTGRTRIFTNQNDVWVPLGNPIYGESSLDYSGRSAAISSDKSTLIIGAHQNDGNGTDAGHARIYDLGLLLSVGDNDLERSVKLFPNPAKTYFTVKLRDGVALEKILIHNTTGELVKSTESKIINTEKLSSGIYILKIYTEKGVIEKKLVIN